MYSYVIEVADSESDLCLFSTALVSKIFAFYHLLEYARGRPGRRGHVHLGQNFFFFFFFCGKVLRSLRVLYSIPSNSRSIVFLMVIDSLIRANMCIFETRAVLNKQDQIRNHRPRLRINTLFVSRKAGGGFLDQYHNF